MTKTIYLHKDTFREALKRYVEAKAVAEANGTTLRDDPSNEVVEMLYKMIGKYISSSKFNNYSEDWKLDMEGTALEQSIKAVRKYDPKRAVANSILRAVDKKETELKRLLTPEEYKQIEDATEENPFGYFTTIINNAFLQVLIKNKKDINTLNSSIIHEAEIHFSAPKNDTVTFKFHRDTLGKSHFKWLQENGQVNDKLFEKKVRKKRTRKPRQTPQCATALNLDIT